VTGTVSYWIFYYAGVHHAIPYPGKVYTVYALCPENRRLSAKRIIFIFSIPQHSTQVTSIQLTGFIYSQPRRLRRYGIVTACPTRRVSPPCRQKIQYRFTVAGDKAVKGYTSFPQALWISLWMMM